MKMNVDKQVVVNKTNSWGALSILVIELIQAKVFIFLLCFAEYLYLVV